MSFSIDELADAAIHPLDRKVRVRARRALLVRVKAALAGEDATPERVAIALGAEIESARARIEREESAMRDLTVALQGAGDQRARRKTIEKYLDERVDHPRARRGDKRALDRWLDAEALQERAAAAIADAIDECDLGYQLLSGLVRSERSVAPAVFAARIVQRAMQNSVPTARPALRRAALSFVREALRAMPFERRSTALGLDSVRTLRSYAEGEGAARWIQIRALESTALLLGGEVVPLVERVTKRADGDDSMVIRSNALRILAETLGERALPLLAAAKGDPSEHVRQVASRLLARLPHPNAGDELESLLFSDKSERVSAFALRELTSASLEDDERSLPVERSIARALREIKRPLVVRIAFESIRRLVAADSPHIDPRVVVSALASLVASEAHPMLLDEGAEVLRWMKVRRRKEVKKLHAQLQELLAELYEGESRAIELPEGTKEIDLENALASAARGDMTVSAKRLRGRRYRITRGEPRRLRLWRALNELKTPMPDKRKGYPHAHARAFQGEILVPSSVMAEVTPTRVPGERQLYGPLGGWGSFLPRLDDLLAAASVSPRTIRLIVPGGVVEISSPKALKERLRAFVRISLDYPKLAALRERSLLATEAAERRAFADKAESLGYRVVFHPNEGRLHEIPYRVSSDLPLRFLSATTKVASVVPFIFLEPIVAYLSSPFGSTPAQLAVVASLVFIGVVLRSAATMQGIERARRAIPLTVGGWGTRGKSGSERLKAALFHALRYDVVVKTTGCEAMFIHAMRDLPAQEIFIYRPYDKATIWEQRNVLQTGTRLRTQVFLWECMALQPRFVDTLANEWMQDDVTTLTNAYPDHEDIQGPGGEDVARVIGRFTPIRGTTFTTEEQMLPLLRDSARRKGTDLRAIAPIEADLLPVDLLDRLPYQEHPRNVAMVLTLAEYFGVDREFAIVEIADHVVLDLGVLKTYPEIGYRSRKLTFSNGMSANERAGFMSNWLRLGFDKNDVDKEPEIATVAVVNNRADRVARSRVFAQIFVDDASVDHVVLINSNLGGMMQFIEEALLKKIAGMTILGEGGTSRALERFDEAMKWLKVPSKDDSLEGRVDRMLTAIGVSEAQRASLLASSEIQSAITSLASSLGDLLLAELMKEASTTIGEDAKKDVARHASRVATRMKKRKDARTRVEESLAAGDGAGADATFKAVYRELFMDRIAVLWDSGATGDQVIDFMTTEIAPGQRARVMGCQNIKGTGLDFVYRWLSIDRVRTAILKMKKDRLYRGEGVAFLTAYSDFGLLDCKEALSFMKEAEAEREGWEPQLVAAAVSRLSQLEQEKTARLKASGKMGLGARILLKIEAVFDYLDSVRRTRLAKAVLEDLFAARVGHGQAALLLRDVTGRQKGGWLLKDIKKALARWSKKATAG